MIRCLFSIDSEILQFIEQVSVCQSFLVSIPNLVFTDRRLIRTKGPIDRISCLVLLLRVPLLYCVPYFTTRSSSVNFFIGRRKTQTHWSTSSLTSLTSFPVGGSSPPFSYLLQRKSVKRTPWDRLRVPTLTFHTSLLRVGAGGPL